MTTPERERDRGKEEMVEWGNLKWLLTETSFPFCSDKNILHLQYDGNL